MRRRCYALTALILILLFSSRAIADLDYVMQWVADEMRIEINPDLPRPLVIRFS